MEVRQQKSLADVTNEDDSITPGLKTKKKEIIKSQASGLLTPTDWHVVKAAEVESYSIPAAMTTYRAAVRTASNDMEVLIDACNTVDGTRGFIPTCKYRYRRKSSDGKTARRVA